jgi:hypothetical protein
VKPLSVKAPKNLGRLSPGALARRDTPQSSKEKPEHQRPSKLSDKNLGNIKEDDDESKVTTMKSLTGFDSSSPLKPQKKAVNNESSLKNICEVDSRRQIVSEKNLKAGRRQRSVPQDSREQFEDNEMEGEFYMSESNRNLKNVYEKVIDDGEKAQGNVPDVIKQQQVEEKQSVGTLHFDQCYEDEVLSETRDYLGDLNNKILGFGSNRNFNDPEPVRHFKDKEIKRKKKESKYKSEVQRASERKIETPLEQYQPDPTVLRMSERAIATPYTTEAKHSGFKPAESMDIALETYGTEPFDISESNG